MGRQNLSHQFHFPVPFAPTQERFGNPTNYVDGHDYEPRVSVWRTNRCVGIGSLVGEPGAFPQNKWPIVYAGCVRRGKLCFGDTF